MDTVASVLAANRERIVSAAFEQADTDDYIPILNHFVDQLTDNLRDGTDLSITKFRERGVENRFLLNILRAVESESIDVLHDSLIDSRATYTPFFKESILTLRKSIRQVRPPAEIDLPEKNFFFRLLKGETSKIESCDKFIGLFRDMMMVVRDIFFVFDMNGNIFYANDYGMVLTGYDTDDICNGLSIYDLVVSEYTDLIEARLESPTAAIHSPYSIAIYSKDGQRIPVEIISNPMMAEGKVCAIMCVARDLRLERLLSREVRHTNSRLQTILSAVSTGIIFTDADGIITEANPIALSLFGADNTFELVGKPIFDFEKKGGNRIRDSFSQVLSSGKVIRTSYSTNTEIERKVDCEMVVISLDTTATNPDGIALLINDITEQSVLQNDFLQTERLLSLGDVIAGVAHEINNPLTGINGYAQMLLAADVDEGSKSKLSKIISESDRCSKIVSGLLAFAGETSIYKKAHDINHVFKEILSLRDYQLRADDINIEVDLAEEPLIVDVDSQELQRAFLNFFINAHQALVQVDDRQRKLMVRTSKDKNTIKIMIGDNGPGIPREIQSKIFNPFFTTRQFGEGTGLGLSVAYGIIRSHGGLIDLATEQNVGTTFTISFPEKSSD